MGHRSEVMFVNTNPGLATDKSLWQHTHNHHLFQLPDLVVCPHPDPVGNRSVLLQLLSQLLLHSERLMGRLEMGFSLARVLESTITQGW